MRSYLLVMGTLSLQLACGERVVPANETPAPPLLQGPTPSVPAVATPVAPTITDSIVSPDGAMSAWVATIGTDSSELWIAFRDGRGPSRIAASTSVDDAPVPLYGDLTFTLDGECLVYLVPRFVTSHGVDVVDLATLEVIETDVGAHEIIQVPRGQYAGMLVLLQARRIEGMGRVFQYWLHTADLEPIQKVADESGYDAWAAKHIPPP